MGGVQGRLEPFQSAPHLLCPYQATGTAQPLNCARDSQPPPEGLVRANGFSGVLVHPGPRLPDGIMSSEFNARKIINFHPQVYFWGSLPINSAN